MVLGNISNQTVRHGMTYLPHAVPKWRKITLPQIKYKHVKTIFPYIIFMVGAFFLPSIAAKFVPGCMRETGFKEFDRTKDYMTGYSWNWWKSFILDYPKGSDIKVGAVYSKGKALVKIAKFIGVFLINMLAGDKISVALGGKGGKEEVPPEKAPEAPVEEKPPEVIPDPPAAPSPPSDPGGII